MDKLRNILDTIYNTEHGMLYFYLILGAIALIFVVLIIITIVKAKKEDKILKEVEKNNPALKSEPQEEVKEPVKVELKEEQTEELKEEQTEELKEEQEEYEPEYYSETQIFNKVLMDTNNYNNNEDLTPSPVQNEEIPLTIPETNELNKPETNDSVYLEPVKEDLEDKSIGELFTEELPVIYPEMNEEELNKEETQEETPVIQDTPVVPEKPKEEKEENKELTNTQSIHISNDEIKARLAKLKNLKKEEPAPAEKEIPLEQSDTGLINIMSNAGINDDMELPAIKEARNTEEIDTNKTI